MCKVDKPISEYYILRKGKTQPVYNPRCKSCNYDVTTKYYKSLDEDVKNKFRKKNPCNSFEYRQKYRLKNKFGLTVEEYSAMIEKQDNKCKICGCDMNKPHVDHNHKTGKVRHLLCHQCNTALGLLKEDTRILQNMISYINNDNL